MKLFHIIPYHIIFLILPALAQAAAYDTILESITPGAVIVIGEHHQEKESSPLFQEIVASAVKRNLCPIIALEIASNQQTAIDNAMTGKGGVEDISVSSIIDHPAYRKMLARFVEMKHEGACLRILAIDAGDDVDMTRDKWMASRIQKQGRDVTVLALLGNQHALQRVRWNHSRGAPSVAEILKDSGRNVKTFLQSWPDSCGTGRHSRFYDATQPAALSALHRTFSVMNAEEPTSAAAVVNGVIAWECDNPSRDNVSHSQVSN